MDADLVVVGAGPAGSMAGYRAARLGLRTIIIDKENFPRDKPCGGGLAANSIDFLIENNLIDVLDGIEKFSFTGYRIYSYDNKMFQAPVTTKNISKECFVVRRSDFDNALLKKAIEAGCRFLPGYTASSLNQDEEEVEILTNKGVLNAKVVIVADGSGISLTRKILPDAESGRSIAAMAFYEDVSFQEKDLTIVCDKRMVNGYGWFFPLPGGKANVGAGIDLALLKKRRQNIRDYFNYYINKDPIKGMIGKGKINSKIRSFPLRLNYLRANFNHKNIIFAGDAANLIYPLSGEGIAYAMKSGKIAAGVMSEALRLSDRSVLEKYKNLLDEQFSDFAKACLFKNKYQWIWLQKLLFNMAVNDDEFCKKSVRMLENTIPCDEFLSPKLFFKLLAKGLFAKTRSPDIK